MSHSTERLYQELARKLIDELGAGAFAVGVRLPAERELAQAYQVSRTTMREAIIALEVQGLVEVRIGSGTYVLRCPGKEDLPGFNITAFELTEARLLFEGEAAALACLEVTEAEIAQIGSLLENLAHDDQMADGDQADREFHLAIARATRNQAVLETIEHLWELRYASPEAALLHEKARRANVKPVIDEHTAVVEALKARDPAGARAAMRAHLAEVLESLLFATEAKAVEEARRTSASKRARYSRATA